MTWTTLLRLRRHLLLPTLMGLALPAHAEIYVCIDASGRTITHDRPIVECLDREQRVLNHDGSLNRIMGPSMSAEERAAAEAAERRQRLQQQARLEQLRRDRNLVQRYPNEAAHQRARDLALDQTRVVTRAAQERLAQLEAERKPLENEAEFYRGRELPMRLQQDLEFNTMASALQRQLIVRQQEEARRIHERFDEELERLKSLWATSAASPASRPSAR